VILVSERILATGTLQRCAGKLTVFLPRRHLETSCIYRVSISSGSFVFIIAVCVMDATLCIHSLGGSRELCLSGAEKQTTPDPTPLSIRLATFASAVEEDTWEIKVLLPRTIAHFLLEFHGFHG
jgi:hypothetical protein